jgi:AcrR family transcriptional regulator
MYESLFSIEPSSGQKRMMQIIEGAIKCYASVGIENTTYDRIAKACKITRPLIQHYFKDLDEIFEVAVKFIRANFQRVAIEAIQKESKPKEQLMAYVESTFQWVKEYPAHANTWKLVYYYCDLDPKLRKLQTEMVYLGLDRIAGLLEIGKSQKVFGCKDVRTTANFIQMLMTGALVKVSTENMDVSLEEFSKEISGACLRIAMGERL